MYDSTGHGYASHLSNGVTFRDCLAHDMVDDAFWWDLSLDGAGRDLVPSNDIVYERCVAHFVKSGANSRVQPHRVHDGRRRWQHRQGLHRDRHRGRCGVVGRVQLAVALARRQRVDVRGQRRAQQPPQRDLLLAERQAANAGRRFHRLPLRSGHLRRGLRQPREVHRLHDLRLRERRPDHLGAAGEAGGDSAETIAYTDMYIDQAGLTDYAVEITKHLSRGGRVTEISGSTFKGGRLAQIGLPSGGDHPQLYDFEDCTFDGNAFLLADDVALETELRVMEPGGTFVVRRADQSGEPRTGVERRRHTGLTALTTRGVVAEQPRQIGCSPRREHLGQLVARSPRPASAVDRRRAVG